MENFCYQCEQVVAGGCVSVGNCGKDSPTSLLQDLVVYAAKGTAMWAHRAARLGSNDPAIGRNIIQALFTTVTNVNFDPATLEAVLREQGKAIEKAKALYVAAAQKAGKTPEDLHGPAAWKPAADLAEQAVIASLLGRIKAHGNDRTGLEELVLYGLKGLSAYLEHAVVLGQEDPALYAEVYELLDLLTRAELTADELLVASLKTGMLNLKVMELLDKANTGAYGDPTPTKVRMTGVKGKAILISGHDLKDLEELLKQTEGKGINVYTHGEMLPAHGYPGLRKYKHLVGNWGGAWQDQRKEFDLFPGAFFFTTNCIQKPKDSYNARVFTGGLVQYPGVRHIEHRDFGPVIEAALAAPGFAEDEPATYSMVGFGHAAVMGVAPQVVEAVKKGAIKHFFLIGGCDGAKSGRNYYTRFAEEVPKDCVILTLACGKFRFNKLDFGDIGGIPRLLDVGQCNDAYSAIQIAVGLSKAFNTDVNSLPLSLVLSWYEQKAVAVLLTLLALGIRNIRVGPSLPAFLTPPVIQVLVDKFGLKPITTVEDDMKAMLANQ